VDIADRSGMPPTQFIELPPITFIQELFRLSTGHPFQLGISWCTWFQVDEEEIILFRPYFRQCHQKLLLETILGVQKNTCSLLRQMLRPYKFAIVRDKKMYTLVEIKEEATGVGKKAGAMVVWNSD